MCHGLYNNVAVCGLLFQEQSQKMRIFTILSWGMPLIFGIAAFIVAAFFTLFIVPFTDDKVLAWFKSIAEPDKDCENE